MKTIIINADDFGKSESINQGIYVAFKHRLINQTTLMVNMPFCEQAIDLLKNTPYINNVGLHLNLTEGFPLTSNIRTIQSLCNENGSFNGRIRHLARSRRFTLYESNAIREEIQAQIDKFFSLGLELKHLDSHHHVHTEYQIFKLLKPLSREFTSLRLARNLQKNSIRSIPKVFYKYCLNLEIKSCFKEYSKYFGSYEDFKRFYKPNSGSVEIMVHPILKNGVVYDIASKNLIVDMSEYCYE